MAGTSPENIVSPTQNQSSPFSIMDILSDEVGQKKSPTSRHNIPLSTPGSSTGVSKLPCRSMFSQENANQMRQVSSETPKRPRKSSSSHFSSRAPMITLSEAGNIVGPGRPVPSMVTPNKPHLTSQMNTSLVSPFNANLLLALGHQPSPSSEEREELFGESSLGMLSEVAVAQYHSELSAAEANSSLEAPVREKLEKFRLVTSIDVTDDGSREAGKEDAPNASLMVRPRKPQLTPGILKRDKRRRFPSAGSDESSRSNPIHFNAGFLSPLANEKSSSTNKDLTFSPSIFLSRPEQSHSSISSDCNSISPSTSLPISRSEGSSISCPPTTLRLSVSPGSECSDCPHSHSDSESGSFITSTPIKGGKENVRKSEEMWSPTILHNRRRLLREPNESSGGNESEAVKKPCLPTTAHHQHQHHHHHHHHHHHKKSKARTKLSPLLENACSPISKESTPHRQPSPLTTGTSMATTPTRDNMSLGGTCQQSVAGTSAPPPPPPPPPPVAAPIAVPPVVALPMSTATTTTTTGARLQPISHHPALNRTTTVGLTLANPALNQQLLAVAHAPTAAAAAVALKFPPNLLSLTAQMPHHPPPPCPPHGHFLLAQPQQSCAFPPPAHPQLQAAAAAAPLSYYNSNNPLVSASSPVLQGYSMVPTAGTPPGYYPIVNFIPSRNPYIPYCSPESYPHHHHHHTQHMMSPHDTSAGRLTAVAANATLSEEGRQQEKKKLKSVPPWFIFSNNRSEKRSRLTEAINKSLSETPAQVPRLPTEWIKLACGQTDDQKHLTEKARMFMQCRPRQLTFNDSASE